MKSKEKTKNTTIRANVCEKNGTEYVYELIMNESLHVASYRLPLYSVSVKAVRNGTEEAAQTSDVFSDVGKAIAFFDRVVDGHTTPSELAYILEAEF